MASVPPSWRSYPSWDTETAACIPVSTDRFPNSESFPHKPGKMGQVPALTDGLSRGYIPGLEGKSQHPLVDSLVTEVSLPFEESVGKSWDPLVEFLKVRAVSHFWVSVGRSCDLLVELLVWEALCAHLGQWREWSWGSLAKFEVCSGGNCPYPSGSTDVKLGICLWSGRGGQCPSLEPKMAVVTCAHPQRSCRRCSVPESSHRERHFHSGPIPLLVHLPIMMPHLSGRPRILPSTLSVATA